MLAIGEVLAGRYRVEGLIGSGGMGIVARARQLDLGRDVAVKIMHRALLASDGLVERFRAEGRVIARLRGAHVPRIFDVGVREDGTPFVVMELLEGATLAERLEAGERLTPGEVVTLGLHLCDAVDEAHRQGIVHRDIKPSNVFLATEADGSVTAKVLDFGIAKDVSHDVTRTIPGETFGSPLYMAPEQMCAASDATASSDLWSIGVVLYEALTGTTPYAGANLGELLLAVHRSPPRPLGDDVPLALREAIASCLVVEPTNRCGSARELAQKLLATTSEPLRAARRSIPCAANDIRDTLVVDLLRSAASAWPGIVAPPARFRCCIAEVLASGARVHDIHAADLYLALACIDGDPNALCAFERTVMPALDRIAGDVRDALLYGPAPALARYRGKRPLADWARVTAHRIALRARGRTSSPPALDLTPLPPSERAVLRLHVEHGLSTRAIARMLGIDVDDAARVIAQVRTPAAV